jgi:type I restriction enzyme R subunit
MAETIENNVRRLITEERPTNPKYYDNISRLLKELIAKRKKDGIKYKKYLEEIAELCKQATHQSSDTDYPDSIDSKGKRALYDNLNSNDEIALAVDKAITTIKADSWRGSKIKEKAVYFAIKKTLKKFNIIDNEKINLIFDIVKEEKNGY